MGFNCFKATEPLQGDSSPSSFSSPGVPGTHFMKFKRMKTELEPLTDFDLWTS